MGLYAEAASLEEQGIPFATVTITGAKGIVPRKNGRMFVAEDGRTFGTVGGGSVEHAAVYHAREALKEGRGRSVSITNGSTENTVDIYIDVPFSPKRVIVIGSGHVGSAVAFLMKQLGWSVKVLELQIDAEMLLSEMIDDKTAVVIAGKAGAGLVPVALGTRAFYVGLLASRSYKTDYDSRLYFPIGLDIGEETPEEIAVSVAAEVMAVFNHRSGISNRLWQEKLVVVRGAGDLATGTIIRLFKAGCKVIALETAEPTVIRRTVSFAEAVYDGEMTVEGVRAVLSNNDSDIRQALDEGSVPVVIDPSLSILERFQPVALVDAIIAKKNLGTKRGMAPVVIALGPGFEAGVDADAVIETKRGHTLGSVIYNGCAIPNSGIPGNIAGYAEERVIHSHVPGVFRGVKNIGDIVSKGDTIAYIGETPVEAPIDGKLRGLLHDGISVPQNFKIADIDPRGEEADHLTVSDKARAIAGGVLEALLSLLNQMAL